MRSDFVYEPLMPESSIGAYDNLARSQSELAKNAERSTKTAVNITKMSTHLRDGTREMSDATNYFTLGLVIISGGALSGNKAIQYVTLTAHTTAAAFSIYESYKAIVAAMKAIEAVKAGIETTEKAIMQDWPGIALAAGVAIAVTGAFGLGYMAGTASVRNLNADISTPMGRRAAISAVGGA